MASCVCTVLAVKPFSGCYPACCECLRKLRELYTAAPEQRRLWCGRCWLEFSAGEVDYRYCVALTVTDHCSCATVVLFGQPLEFIFGLPATQLHRYLEEKSSVAQLNDTLELLQKSLETIFVGRCFVFGFGSAHELQGALAQSICLSDIYQRQTVKKKKCEASSSIVATGIKPLGGYSATVFTILESYFREARQCIPSDVRMHPSAEIRSTPRDCSHLDASSSLISASQLPPALIQLESYCQPSPGEQSASSLPHNARAISKNESCSNHSHPSLEDSPAVRSHLPVCLNTPVLKHVCPKDHNFCSIIHDWSITTPSAVSCGGQSDSEGTVFTDAEASEILQELGSDWERSCLSHDQRGVQGTSLHSTKMQLDGSSPASDSHADTYIGNSLPDSMLNPNLSVSGLLSDTFWAEFNQSFDHPTTPSPAPAQIRTGLSVLLPKAPTCDTTTPCGTPELFPSIQGIASIPGLPSGVRREPGKEATPSIGSSRNRLKKTTSTTSVARSRTMKYTHFSPELFGNSTPRIPPLDLRFTIPPNCAQTSSKQATPSSYPHLHPAVTPIRRNLLKDITNTPRHMHSSPLQITTCTSTGLDETPTQLEFRTQSHNSTFSPELF